MFKIIKSISLIFFLITTIASVFWGCSDNKDCKKVTVSNSDELIQNLSNAEPGTIIEIEAGDYKGSFNIPVGVKLIGKEKSQVIFSNPENNGPVIKAESDDETIQIENLSIIADISGAISANGTGSLEILNIDIAITGKFGINIKNLNKVTISNVQIVGNVTENRMVEIFNEPDPDEFAIAGILLTDIKDCELENIDVSAVASVGVQISNTKAVIKESEIHSSVGVGIIASGSETVEVIGTQIHEINDGASSFGFGIVAMNDVNIKTENVTLKNNALVGMLMDHATGFHKNLIVEENKNRGVWVQYCDPKTDVNDNKSVIFKGESTLFNNNGGLGLGFFESTEITIEGGEINQTKKVEMPTHGERGFENVGDGLEFINSNNISIKDMVLDNNERAGVLVDGDASLEDAVDDSIELNIVFENVKVTGLGDRGFAEQHGVIIHGPKVEGDHLIQADEIGGWLQVPTHISVKPSIINY